MKLEVLLDLISDRQLAEYVAWLDEHPDSDEEDSLDFLMNILTKRQWEDINHYLETDEFNSTPYSNWYGACLHPDGRCFEATMADCRALRGRFQGPGTSCGGYQQPIVMSAEEVGKSSDCCKLNWDDRQLWENTLPTNYCEECRDEWMAHQWFSHPHFESARQEYKNNYGREWPEVAIAEKPWNKSTPSKSIVFNAPEGQIFRDPSSAKDPRLKGDTPPKSVTSYLSKHPEVANLYDDDDASVMMKGVIIGCLIGAVGTIFGNLASEMIVDRWKIHPDFVWDKD